MPASRALALALAAAALAACAGWFSPYEPRAAWRDAAERYCLRSGRVEPSVHIRPIAEIRQDGACGLNRPFRVAAFRDGNVALNSEATLACSMIGPIETWLATSVQPAAFAMLGSPVVEIATMGSYNCRRRNGRSSGPLSEHAFANAIDVSGFVLADGRTVRVESAWRGDLFQSAFLRQIHGDACRHFTTTIGPDGDRHHADHFHYDLARHNKDGSYHHCE